MMQVIEWQTFLDNGLFLQEKKTSMTVGIFDGVHRGHKKLIECIVSHNSHNMAPVVITFRQNHKTEENTSIQTFKQRLVMFENLGIQITIVIDFTEEFKRMSGIEFLKLLAKNGNIGFFAVGSDFKCGHGLDTDAAAIFDFFKSFNIPAEIVQEVYHGSLPISSSRIRKAIATGDILLAEEMLGRSTTALE